jgi:hypothetical protein
MADPRFDPSRAVTFDLTHGLVHREGAPPTVLVPQGGLLALCAAAGHDAAATFGRAVGAAMGGRVAWRFAPAQADSTRSPESADAAAGVRAASIEAVVEHLGGELALGGFGSLAIERWGRALVLVVDHAPLGGAGDVLLEAILEGAVAAATGRPVRVGQLARDQTRARFFVGSSTAVEEVRRSIAAGSPWGDALARLHAGADPGAARGDA